ncbi:MAG: hypothetical protein QOE61_131, partial [Micromonosporaceae bacterium]|nr:hypothetical protein [Micromonosporaceae bacterium]
MAAQARRAGGIGVIDLGGAAWTDGEPDREALASIEAALAWSTGPIAVRVSRDCPLAVDELERVAAGRVDLVILTMDARWPMAATASRYRVLAEVTSPAEAADAARAGAHGLIARGAESGGRVSELGTYVLLQQILAASAGLPVWAAGGIGLRTAAASVLGGAAGVVLDSQLGLLPESDLPGEICRPLRRMDGGAATDREAPSPAPTGDRPDEPPAIGQDGWLAATFLTRFGDTAGAVRAIRKSIVDAVAVPPLTLAPGAALATDLGIRIPVAQGPMTRVSDQAAFAAAVAADGALPFIALALADGERSRLMLDDTAVALAGRPWGVGVLGFVPDALRAEQIVAIRASRPHYAIIAGGRPAQAAELERDGIPTFLHVPSPGLLEQFLRAGSRRFVFEGAECGGHIGPRASFVLWEAQLAVLGDFLDGQPAEVCAEIQIFFAGGVHDSRSAAMVAALAAPLTARGVRIGVLMGTAYLFTEEAV